MDRNDTEAQKVERLGRLKDTIFNEMSQLVLGKDSIVRYADGRELCNLCLPYRDIVDNVVIVHREETGTSDYEDWLRLDLPIGKIVAQYICRSIDALMLSKETDRLERYLRNQHRLRGCRIVTLTLKSGYCAHDMRRQLLASRITRTHGPFESRDVISNVTLTPNDGERVYRFEKFRYDVVTRRHKVGGFRAVYVSLDSKISLIGCKISKLGSLLGEELSPWVESSRTNELSGIDDIETKKVLFIVDMEKILGIERYNAILVKVIAEHLTRTGSFVGFSVKTAKRRCLSRDNKEPGVCIRNHMDTSALAYDVVDGIFSLSIIDSNIDANIVTGALLVL